MSLIGKKIRPTDRPHQGQQLKCDRCQQYIGFGTDGTGRLVEWCACRDQRPQYQKLHDPTNERPKPV